MAGDNAGVRRGDRGGDRAVGALLAPAPAAGPDGRLGGHLRRRAQALRLQPNLVQALLCAASFLCCVPMAMPAGHLVAFCSDLGIPAARGAAMLSVLLGCAFVSRMFWGWLTDRIGGLAAVFAGSACQALAIAAFTVTQDEAGLFAVSAAYGLGFSGIIPAYVVAIRDLLPVSRGVLAGADFIVHRHVRHGVRRLVRRRAL